MTDEKLQEYLVFAKSLAAEAGEIMQHYFRLDYDIEIKADNSPVTIADKAVNSLVIEKVKSRFPNHGVLGEEESFSTDSEYLWVCDPIDGTVAYTYHMPVAMFSLALVKKGDPIVAVAHNPFTKDSYHAVKDSGAYINNKSIKVSNRNWGNALIVKTGSNRPDDLLDSVAMLNEIQTHGNSVPQTYGCVFKGCLVAEGSVDGHIFPGIGAHDIAAIKLLVEEAGGTVTDLSGASQPYNKSINGAVLTNGVIHNDLMQVVRKYAHSRN